MSTADRPAAVPAQPTATLDHQDRSTLGAARRDSGRRAARPGDEHLALAAAVPVYRDSLATQLVRELVRSFDVDGGRIAPEVDRLADRGMDVALKRGLHAHVSRDVDLVGG